jgi:malonate transporter
MTALDSSNVAASPGVRFPVQPFFDVIFPIFAVVGIGALSARLGFLDRAAATMLNRFVFYVALPPLLFRLVVTAPVDRFDGHLLSAFVAVELLIYTIAVLLARWMLGYDMRRSVLVGFTACFSNHVFLVLPIAVFLFGQDAALPIVALIAVDAACILAGTVLALDILAGAGSGRGVALKVVWTTATNTQVLAVAGGILFVFMDVPFYQAIDTFTAFLAGSAGPAGLVALGIILAAPEGKGDRRMPPLVVALKLVLNPVLAFAAVTVFGFTLADAKPALMVAAGPSGAMALVLATRYDLLVDEVARAILLTTVLALISVTLVATL